MSRHELSERLLDSAQLSLDPAGLSFSKFEATLRLNDALDNIHLKDALDNILSHPIVSAVQFTPIDKTKMSVKSGSNPQLCDHCLKEMELSPSGRCAKSSI